MMTPTTFDEFEAAGMAALVRAGEAKDWFAGHFGAAMLSGARLLRLPDLPGAAAMALGTRLADLAAAQRDWYAPLPLGDDAAAPLDPIHDVLRRDAATLRTSGHPTIYMATALELLARRPEWARARVVDALLQLHAAGRDDDPARYFGIDDYFAHVDRAAADRAANGQAAGGREAIAHPTGADAGWQDTDAASSDGVAMVALRRAIDALDHLVADRAIDGRRYFLTGEKIHLLTLAHAIDLLERSDQPDLAAAAVRAHADLTRLVEPSRALEPTPIPPARCTPFDARFWEQDTLDVLHVVKLAESVVALVPRLPTAERRVAGERVAKVWALLGIR